MAGNSKNVLYPYHVITSGDMSADITGAATGIQFLDNVSIQLNFTGTPTGAFFIQGSLDYRQSSTGEILNTGNWVSLQFSSAPVASGSANQILLDLNQLSFPWIRVIYTATSGSGTLNAYISAKSV